MQRKKIAAGNWKMNTTLAEAQELSSQLVSKNIPADVEVILGVPCTHIHSVKDTTKGSSIKIAAQNCHEKDKGAYTGEISACMLKSLDVDAVILGHSERRQYAGETDTLVAAKIDKVLEQGMSVIYCCGEVLEERDADKQNDVVGAQLEEALFHLTPEQLQSVVIAYEPVWAIGTGRTASPEQAQSMHSFIRERIKNKFGGPAAEDISILYGGSVKPANAKEIFAQPDVDGGLVGGASLKADDFGEIILSF